MIKIGQIWKYVNYNDCFLLYLKINNIIGNKVEGIIIDCGKDQYDSGYPFSIWHNKNDVNELGEGWVLFKDRIGEECIRCDKFYNEAKTKQKYPARYKYSNPYYFKCWECEIYYG